MAYSNVQNSGIIIVPNGNISWSPASGPTVGNLVTGRFWHAGSTVYGATDTEDSSGTPKVFNMDVQRKDSTTQQGAAIYSLVIPSGITLPLKNTSAFGAGSNTGQFDEWTGNASSLALDNTNSAVPASSGSPVNGASLNTGANAGMVLTVFSPEGNGVANDGITCTGTNFSQDAVVNNSNVNDAGEMDHRFTSVASTTLNDQISWTSVGNLVCVNVIASYNLPGGGATPVRPPMRTLRGAGI